MLTTLVLMNLAVLVVLFVARRRYERRQRLQEAEIERLREQLQALGHAQATISWARYVPAENRHRRRHLWLIKGGGLGAVAVAVAGRVRARPVASGVIAAAVAAGVAGMAVWAMVGRSEEVSDPVPPAAVGPDGWSQSDSTPVASATEGQAASSLSPASPAPVPVETTVPLPGEAGEQQQPASTVPPESPRRSPTPTPAPVLPPPPSSSPPDASPSTSLPPAPGPSWDPCVRLLPPRIDLGCLLG